MVKRIVACFIIAILSIAKGDAEKWTVSWNAPFLATNSGFGSEASSFLLGLNSTLSPSKWNIAAGLAHGDSIDFDMVRTFSKEYIDFLSDADHRQHTLNPMKTIVICHSEPGAWNVLDGPFYESSSPCPPPTNSQWHTVIGRAMFETDRLPRGWEDRLNAVDEVWVPTKHHKDIFIDGGVDENKLKIVGQGIDAHGQWNPNTKEKIPWEEIDPTGHCKEEDYKFFSVGKWENRKGFDVLIKSFWKAFSPFSETTSNAVGACLVIVTSLYHEEADKVMNKLNQYWFDATGRQKDDNFTTAEEVGRQRIILLSKLPIEYLIRLYKTMDVFVLPSRGEGWGRPYMEAMAMEKPVVATNFSGPTEFVTEENGYLLPIEGMVNAHLDAFPGHQWADPDGEALQKLMMYLRDNPEEGRKRGKRAREDVLEHWTHSKISGLVAKHLERLAGINSSSSKNENQIMDSRSDDDSNVKDEL